MAGLGLSRCASSVALARPWFALREIVARRSIFAVASASPYSEGTPVASAALVQATARFER